MDAAFWHARWAANQIGFHENEFHGYLQHYWSQLKVAKQSCVFVPLCGKSRDMLYLLEMGHSVLGVEVSPLAVEAFFQENQLPATPRAEPPFQTWQYEEVTLLQGDFFALRAEHVQQVRAVYDRAALIALPPEMRRQYAQHLIEILPDNIPVLLITLEYEQTEMKGPPFSVSQQEVFDLFSSAFEISLLEHKAMLEESPRFQQKGLTALFENAYYLRPVKR